MTTRIELRITGSAHTPGEEGYVEVTPALVQGLLVGIRYGVLTVGPVDVKVVVEKVEVS